MAAMLEGWNNETVLYENRSYFPGERKCIVFALLHGANDVDQRQASHFQFIASYVWCSMEKLGIEPLQGSRIRGRQLWEAVNLFRDNPCFFFKHMFALIALSVSFSAEIYSVSFWTNTLTCSWNVGHVLKTAWKWNSWSLTTQMSALFHIFTCAFCLL